MYPDSGFHPERTLRNVVSNRFLSVPPGVNSLKYVN